MIVSTLNRRFAASIATRKVASEVVRRSVIIVSILSAVDDISKEWNLRALARQTWNHSARRHSSLAQLSSLVAPPILRACLEVDIRHRRIRSQDRTHDESVFEECIREARLGCTALLPSGFFFGASKVLSGVVGHAGYVHPERRDTVFVTGPLIELDADAACALGIGRGFRCGRWVNGRRCCGFCGSRLGINAGSFARRAEDVEVVEPS